MNYNESYEETIDLKDLCIYILRKWRILLLAFVLGAGVLGGYKAVKGLESGAISEAGSKAAQEAQEELETQEKAWWEQHEETIEAIKSTLKTNEAQLTLANQRIRTSEETIERLEEQLSVWEQELEDVQRWMEEAVTVEDRTNVASQMIELNNNILLVQNQISAAQVEIVNCQAEIVKLEESNKSQEASLKKAQEDEFVPDEELVKKSTPAPSGAEGKSAIVKFAAAGALLGVFCVCGVAFLQYILCGKLRGADELKERFGIWTLGSLHMPERKNHTVVDKWLDKLAGDAESVDAAKQYDLIAAGIQVMSEAQMSVQRKKIMVTGTVEADILKQVCAQLQEVLPQNQYQLWAAENPAYNAQALRQIGESNILLVEIKDGSEKKEIGKLVELLSAGKAQVVGAVLL